MTLAFPDDDDFIFHPLHFVANYCLTLLDLDSSIYISNNLCEKAMNHSRFGRPAHCDKGGHYRALDDATQQNGAAQQAMIESPGRTIRLVHTSNFNVKHYVAHHEPNEKDYVKHIHYIHFKHYHFKIAITSSVIPCPTNDL